MDIHTDASMRSYELLSNEAAYPSTPGKTHDMGNGKVSLKHKQDRYVVQINLQLCRPCGWPLSIEEMIQMHASGPFLEL